jgi:hypothetical protein
MTANVARRSRRRTSEPGPEPIGSPTEALAIGEISQTLFDCPSCARPLALGARRCPGCGTRLVLGVAVSKASVLVALGLAAGLAFGGAVGFGVGSRSAPFGSVPAVAIVLPSASAVAPSAPPPSVGPAPSKAVAASPAPGGSSGQISPITRSALSQAIDVNGRLSASATALRAILDAPEFDASAAAQILRTMSADATFGQQIATLLNDWPGSVTLGRHLSSLYDGVHATATEGLVASVRDTPAYQSTAVTMLNLLGRLPALDAEAQAIADQVGLDVTASAAP